MITPVHKAALPVRQVNILRKLMKTNLYEPQLMGHMRVHL